MDEEKTIPVPPPTPGSDATVAAASDATLPTAEALARKDHAPRRLGKFELLEELGSGGMGTVYKAFQSDLQRVVALKTMHGAAAAGAAMVERFQREARAAARLDHPGIVRVFEVGFEAGVHFIAMELVAGENLLARVRRGSPPLPDRVRWLRDAALAVHHAHEQGLVHRDIKPQNLLLDGQGNVKVADFGLARDVTAERGLTVSGETMGTPQYMAPEQARGKWDEVGPRSDVYSLGATLYEAIAGVPPVDGKDVYSILEKVVKGDLVPLRRLVPKVPRDIETICQKALDVDPSRRYASARDLAEDMDRFLKFEPILARPLSLPERLLRGARRHRARLALLGVAALAVTAALVMLAVGKGTVERAREAQDQARRTEESTKLVRLATNADHVLANGGLDEQVRLLARAIEASPQNAEAHFRLAVLQEWSADLDGALLSYDRAAQDPSYAARARSRQATMMYFFARGNPEGELLVDRAEQMIDRCRHDFPGDPYPVLAEEYRDALRGRDWSPETAEDRLARIEEMSATAPEAALLYAGIRGLFYHPLYAGHLTNLDRYRNTDAALRTLQAMVNSDRLDYLARLNLGLLRLDLGHLDAAEEDLRMVSNLAPSWPDPPYYLGRVLFSQRKLAEADVSLLASAKLKARPRVLNYLAVVRIARDDLPGVLAATEGALAAEPGEMTAVMLRALCLKALDREAEAKSALEGLSEKDRKYWDDVRDLDKELRKPQMRLVVDVVRRSLRDFPEVLFMQPKQKASVRTSLEWIAQVPRLSEVTDRVAGRKRVRTEADFLLANLGWIERDHPKAWGALEWLLRQFGVRTDLAAVTVLVEFAYRLGRDADYQAREGLVTLQEHHWKAGILYRKGRYVEAEQILELAKAMDGSNPKTHYALAMMRAIRGDARGCADSLWQARQFGWSHIEWVLEDPDFAKVRDDPAVKAAIEAK